MTGSPEAGGFANSTEILEAYSAGSIHKAAIQCSAGDWNNLRDCSSCQPHSWLKRFSGIVPGKVMERPGTVREHDYIAFAEYYNEPNGRSFGNCDIYNTTITWLRKHDHMARYFPIFLVFGTKFQYFDNRE